MTLPLGFPNQMNNCASYKDFHVNRTFSKMLLHYEWGFQMNKYESYGEFHVNRTVSKIQWGFQMSKCVVVILPSCI